MVTHKPICIPNEIAMGLHVSGNGADYSLCESISGAKSSNAIGASSVQTRRSAEDGEQSGSVSSTGLSKGERSPTDAPVSVSSKICLPSLRASSQARKFQLILGPLKHHQHQLLLQLLHQPR